MILSISRAAKKRKASPRSIFLKALMQELSTNTDLITYYHSQNKEAFSKAMGDLAQALTKRMEK